MTGHLAGGMTSVTTAHLTNAIDDRYVEIERLHGLEGSRLAAESHTAAIASIEANVRNEGIDCDFMRLDGYLFTPPGGDAGLLDQELEAAHRAGLDGRRQASERSLAELRHRALPCASHRKGNSILSST
jgi:hypothetical protein